MFEPQPSPQRKRDSCGCLDGCDVAELGCDAIDCAPDCSLLTLTAVLAKVVIGAVRADAIDPFTSPGGVASRIASRLVRSYQVNVSKPRGRAVCNLTPSCSRYGLQVLAEHGTWRGAALIRRRLRLCQLTGRARRRA